jgi:hypothetical protein
MYLIIKGFIFWWGGHRGGGEKNATTLELCATLVAHSCFVDRKRFCSIISLLSFVYEILVY